MILYFLQRWFGELRPEVDPFSGAFREKKLVQRSTFLQKILRKKLPDISKEIWDTVGNSFACKIRRKRFFGVTPKILSGGVKSKL